MTRVLREAARIFGWSPGKAPSGRGYGLAAGIDAGTYVAHMAEVEVDKKTLEVRVKRVVCRFSWLPKIEAVLIDDKNAAPQGGGEPAIIAMGAVIANAVFDAAGARVRQVPVTPERIKQALG